MAQSVHGKAAIVTGAGSGINLCFARLLHSKGCSVLIADLYLRPETQSLVTLHANSTHRVIFLKIDVRKWDDLSNMFTVAVLEFGRIDIICPGAGVFEPLWSNFWHPPGSKDAADMPDGNCYALLDINITHPIRLTQLAISHFLSGDNGDTVSLANPKTIIHISSLCGQATPLPSPLYNASKHAINGFVRSLGPLEKELGIRVAAVAPGVVKTPMWTANPEKMRGTADETVWVTPEEVAEVMLALVERDEICSSAGDEKGERNMIPIRGGSVVEVSAGTVRDVMPFNDPGPAAGPGNDLENMWKMEMEAMEVVRMPGWGKAKI